MRKASISQQRLVWPDKLPMKIVWDQFNIIFFAIKESYRSLKPAVDGRVGDSHKRHTDLPSLELFGYYLAHNHVTVSTRDRVWAHRLHSTVSLRETQSSLKCADCGSRYITYMHSVSSKVGTLEHRHRVAPPPVKMNSQDLGKPTITVPTINRFTHTTASLSTRCNPKLCRQIKHRNPQEPRKIWVSHSSHRGIRNSGGTAKDPRTT